MEQQQYPEQLLPQEVIMYLDRFDQVPASEALQYHRELHGGALAQDLLKTRLHGYFMHAMALYPERSQYTNPGGATEMYAAFATSDDANDTLRMLSVVANLWAWEPNGATKVMKLCLRRPIWSKADQTIYATTYDMTRRALLDQAWADDGSDPLGHIAVARIRRELSLHGGSA